MDEIENEFHALMLRVRVLDPEATRELLDRFEPEIRLKIRTWLRLRNPDLRSRLDSMDICQSVMADFFLRVASGQYDLEDPDRVLGLLVTMARHKLGEQAKHHYAQRRDIRRSREIEQASGVGGMSDTPSGILIGQELLWKIRARLVEEEREIADLRMLGLNWPDIATRIGGTAEARRKQWTRAVERVTNELNLTLRE